MGARDLQGIRLAVRDPDGNWYTELIGKRSIFHCHLQLSGQRRTFPGTRTRLIEICNPLRFLIEPKEDDT
jgi:hypothetical protein